jgi:hypothetical protein
MNDYEVPNYYYYFEKKGCEVAYKKWNNILDFLGLLILERNTGSNFNILVSLCFLFSLGLLILLHPPQTSTLRYYY